MRFVIGVKAFLLDRSSDRSIKHELQFLGQRCVILVSLFLPERLLPVYTQSVNPMFSPNALQIKLRILPAPLSFWFLHSTGNIPHKTIIPNSYAYRNRLQTSQKTPRVFRIYSWVLSFRLNTGQVQPLDVVRNGVDGIRSPLFLSSFRGVTCAPKQSPDRFNSMEAEIALV